MSTARAPRIFITGASSGIGAALAAEYARRHPQATIGLLGRREAALEAVAQAMAPVATLRHAVDVTDTAALAEAARDFLQQAGTPDVVVANAGISAGTITGEASDSPVFRRIVETNLIAMPDTFAPFVAAMRERGSGTLVGIASVAGVRGMPGAGAYSASKAAAIAYLESLRLELRGSGVSVVTIVPGFVRTPMTAHNRYSMPFLIDADLFASRAVDAIAARRSFAVIPWQMRIVAALVGALPNPVFDRLFAKAPRKARLEGVHSEGER